jgi:L-lactate dehydrogenase complex protein LldG
MSMLMPDISWFAVEGSWVDALDPDCDAALVGKQRSRKINTMEWTDHLDLPPEVAFLDDIQNHWYGSESRTGLKDDCSRASRGAPRVGSEDCRDYGDGLPKISLICDVRHWTGPNPLLPSWAMAANESVIAPPNNLERFVVAATAAVATVEVIERSSASVCDAILRAAGDANRILFAPPQDLPSELFGDFARDPRVRVDPTPEEMVNSPAGVTEAFAGVARTGSVCVNVGFQKTGMENLLAPLHIAVVAAETIVPQPRDLFREDLLDGKGLVRNFVFITGPSATADMGPLVRGVHGPHRLHIVVLQ